MKKVLIIGGNGFIGSNICQYFNNINESVSIYETRACNLGEKNYVGNILDDNNFEKIVANYDVIIYLITAVSPQKSMLNPNSAYLNDIPLLIKTLDACVKGNTNRIVFASSGGSIYGDSNNIKLKESDNTLPQNHYAICKLACENILLMYNKLYNMENISLRISNPYGNNQKTDSGVGVITTFVNEIVLGNPINLYGDGSITRDFICVEDVAQAFYLATYWEFDKNITPIFNVGSGEVISLLKIIEIIADSLQIEPIINYLPERNFDVKYNVLDISKTQKILKYDPTNNKDQLIRKYVKKIYDEKHM